MSTIIKNRALPMFDGQAHGVQITTNPAVKALPNLRIDLGANGSSIDGVQGLILRLLSTDLDNTAVGSWEIYSCADGSDPAVATNYSALSGDYVHQMNTGTSQYHPVTFPGFLEIAIPPETLRVLGRYVTIGGNAIGASPEVSYEAYWRTVLYPGPSPIKDRQTRGEFTETGTSSLIQRNTEIDLTGISGENFSGMSDLVVWFRATAGADLTSYSLRPYGCVHGDDPTLSASWKEAFGSSAVLWTTIDGTKWGRIMIPAQEARKFRWIALLSSGVGGAGFSVTVESYWQIINN